MDQSQWEQLESPRVTEMCHDNPTSELPSSPLPAGLLSGNLYDASASADFASQPAENLDTKRLLSVLVPFQHARGENLVGPWDALCHVSVIGSDVDLVVRGGKVGIACATSTGEFAQIKSRQATDL
jgi:hypothetical protein